MATTSSNAISSSVFSTTPSASFSRLRPLLSKVLIFYQLLYAVFFFFFFFFSDLKKKTFKLLRFCLENCLAASILLDLNFMKFMKTCFIMISYVSLWRLKSCNFILA